MPRLKTREPATDSSPERSPQSSAHPHLTKFRGWQRRTWRRTCRIVAAHPRLISTLLLITAASGTSVFLLYQLFKGAWPNYQDNAVILETIAKMELRRESARAIKADPERVVTRTYLTLEPYLEPDGWTWIDRFGSTSTYSRQDQRLIASCSPYSPLYLVCHLSEIP
ncbi:MAG: hypothetical protein WA885_07460 [Phormidesmis sp.]